MDPTIQEIKNLVQHIAPTLASALGGPFYRVALTFIADNLITDRASDERSTIEIVTSLLNDAKQLQNIKSLDDQFKSEMKKLSVDVFALDTQNKKNIPNIVSSTQRPQIFLSALFLIAYFLMLAAIFVVEVSDSLNMVKGENSLMGELQILFGVLTAGVGQVLSYWFGGVFGRKESSSSSG